MNYENTRSWRISDTKDLFFYKIVFINVFEKQRN